MPRQILVQVVRRIDDVQQDRKSERCRDEYLPELGEDVPVERANVQLHCESRRARRSPRLGMRIFTQPLIVSSSSRASPPRAVDPSAPIRASSQSAIAAKSTSAIHI